MYVNTVARKWVVSRLSISVVEQLVGRQVADFSRRLLFA